MSSSAKTLRSNSSNSLTSRFETVRSLTVRLTDSLTAEDTVVQSMPDVSPTKWHLAHVTWFFERFVLQAYVDGYKCFNDDFDFLFNSYYYTAGQMHARPQRGLLSRPTLNEVLDYRKHVDEAMCRLLDKRGGEDELGFLTTLGLNHEQQHQELLLTDIKHVLSCNPMRPAANSTLTMPPKHEAAALSFANVSGGIQQTGASGDGFCFDSETPRHDVLLHEHCIANRLVTNAEFLEFVRAGGYSDSSLWLADGWALINERAWDRPLYWEKDLATEFTLAGVRELDLQAPVAHVSYYEADAYARWADARLPTEFEWEHSANAHAVDGNLLDSAYWHPAASATGQQFYGDVWEWTSSSYAPYPGFKPLAGSLGEYNGKFMCNQMTVRGGSCVTSRAHIRASYRSFFYPDARWQFLGFRLAMDGTQ
jgi:ergothioneine biosynthesis protein EgtB